VNSSSTSKAGKTLLIGVCLLALALYALGLFGITLPIQSAAITFLSSIVIVAILVNVVRFRRRRHGPAKALEQAPPYGDVLTYKSFSIVSSEAAKEAYLLNLATAVGATDKQVVGRVLADYSSGELTFREAEAELEERLGEIQGRKIIFP
jgi:hypothetical protein